MGDDLHVDSLQPTPGEVGLLRLWCHPAHRLDARSGLEHLDDCLEALLADRVAQYVKRVDCCLLQE